MFDYHNWTVVYKFEHRISKSVTDDWISTPSSTAGPSFIARGIVSYYSPTLVLTRAVMKAAKRNVIHKAEASWKLKARPTDWRRWNIWGSAPLWPVCMFPGWAKFMTSSSSLWQILPNTGTKRYVPPHCAIHITCLAYISQSISQAKQTFIVPYVARESDASHYAQRPPTTN